MEDLERQPDEWYEGEIEWVHSWLDDQEGKPYVWGDVGPKGYDVSGFPWSSRVDAVSMPILGNEAMLKIITGGVL